MPMKSTPSGSSASLCQTIAGLRPVTSSSATARSRSQFDPGKTMTALFMASVHTGKICGKRGSSGVLQTLDPEILDHRVGEQLAAHVLDVRIARRVGKIELDELARPHIVDARKPQPLQRMVDGLALRVEDTGLEGDEDSRFHGLPMAVGLRRDKPSYAAQIPTSAAMTTSSRKLFIGTRSALGMVRMSGVGGVGVPRISRHTAATRQKPAKITSTDAVSFPTSGGSTSFI